MQLYTGAELFFITPRIGRGDTNPDANDQPGHLGLGLPSEPHMAAHPHALQYDS